MQAKELPFPINYIRNCAVDAADIYRLRPDFRRLKDDASVICPKTGSAETWLAERFYRKRRLVAMMHGALFVTACGFTAFMTGGAAILPFLALTGAGIVALSWKAWPFNPYKYTANECLAELKKAQSKRKPAVF